MAFRSKPNSRYASQDYNSKYFSPKVPATDLERLFGELSQLIAQETPDLTNQPWTVNVHTRPESLSPKTLVDILQVLIPSGFHFIASPVNYPPSKEPYRCIDLLPSTNILPLGARWNAPCKFMLSLEDKEILTTAGEPIPLPVNGEPLPGSLSSETTQEISPVSLSSFSSQETIEVNPLEAYTLEPKNIIIETNLSPLDYPYLMMTEPKRIEGVLRGRLPPSVSGEEIRPLPGA